MQKLKTAGVTDYTNQTPPKHFGCKKVSKFNSKIRKYFSNAHKIRGAYLICMEYDYAKFEKK